MAAQAVVVVIVVWVALLMAVIAVMTMIVGSPGHHLLESFRGA